MNSTPDKCSDGSEWVKAMNNARDEMWAPEKEEVHDDMPDASTTERVCMYTCVYMCSFVIIHLSVCVDA